MEAGSSACDFCGESRATVYCRADSARLCLLCDRHVHGANALSRRHQRTLLCDACNLRPAAFRCTVENVTLCHSCDWDSHGGSNSSSCSPAVAAALQQHMRHPFDCFSGCPSAQELGSLWGCAEVLPISLSLSLSLSLHFFLFHGASIDSDLVGLVTDLHADRGSDDGEGKRRTWKQTAAAVVQGSTSAAASKVGSSRPTNAADAAGSSSSYVVANIKETSNLFPI